MQVPFVDLKAQYQSIKNEVEENIQEVLDTGSYIQGPLLRDFEQAFARFCGVSGCVGVASGCDALLWALEACGIGEGDEVITQVNTYAATVLAIMRAGAEPVLVDCREDDYQMDVSAVRAVITKKTRAIMPVHLYGHPADMDAVLALADEYDLAVIEDAAQAHGAMYKNKPCGSMGMAGCFSFYPGKNLGAYGDGGAVVSNDGQIIDHVRMVINYGQSRKYHHDLVGWNARLDTLQAG
ncbi:MAG: DegT/DnrJ/EryC1/StrS family aminotransferase, partial [Verrucomicrobiae bacterium]|nr:DegT/DnrJ/EryC1/StrS family aminotransferase [Verrucomicrobiae bacterium]